ncbi:helix-turn-helix domain-containing protein [Brevibacterium album]|uniref:helix-turn-helix domain-containing protein n=1 Tax=Brevibacterium album TaxID=417948 RepID=UPI0003F9919C|nr:helix-turn-helix domain-containing protein [Brevibacterium album]
MKERNGESPDDGGVGAAARALLDAATQLSRTLSEETVTRATEQTSSKVSAALREAAETLERMPRKPAARGRSTRRELLAAAGKVFAEKGFHAASLGEVAARAGYTKGAIYAHFSSKDEVMLALIREATEVGGSAPGGTAEPMRARPPEDAERRGKASDAASEWSESESIDALAGALGRGALAEAFAAATEAPDDDAGGPAPVMTNLLLSVEMMAYVLRNPEHKAEFAPRFQETMEHLALGLRAAVRIRTGEETDGGGADAAPGPAEMSSAIAFASIVNMAGLYGALGVPAVTPEGTAEVIDRMLGLEG